MSQSIFGFGLGGTGIVAVLIIAGILMSKTGVSSSAASTALTAGVSIGTILGILGIIGVLITLFKRVI
jgi:hypothetical protein